LTNNPAEDSRPIWSPDGRWIAFASKRDGNFEIYIMKADGAQPTRVTNHSADEYTPYWQPVPSP
ncbi:MAG: hypothetical protein AB1817_13045, partial [Chloroflexota bacterium]